MDSLLGILIIFPLGAALIGFIYLWMFYRLKTVSALLTGLLWLSYSIYELLMYLRILCTGECNIRIDLLVIYPLLILCSLISSGLYWYKKIQLKNDRRAKSSHQ